MTAIQNVTQSTQTVNKADKPDFGRGRYSALMEETFNDARTIFKLTSAQAEKLARQIATELGAIMASASVDVRLGKLPAKGDAKITISEASKIKGVTLTNTLMALKALHFAGEAGKNGFSFALTEWKPVQGLQEFLASL